MPAQDDARESQMVQLFNLSVPDDRKRADIDAHLDLDGMIIDFELKSTTRKSVSTVRDFGPDHIAKWRAGLHWIFAFYDRTGTKLDRCYYASPADMEPWIAEQEAYIRPDFLLADKLPSYVSHDMVVSVLGEKSIYSQQDARQILKKQWNVARYLERQDLPTGYSLERMTELLTERAAYLLKRGSTLNNPHINAAFFAGFESIKVEHAAKLRELVRSYLASTAATDAATA